MSDAGDYFDSKYQSDQVSTTAGTGVSMESPVSLDPAHTEGTRPEIPIEPEKYGVGKPRRVVIRGQVTYDKG